MAYADRPHIHTILGTYTNKFAFMEDVTGVLVASGWELQTLSILNTCTENVNGQVNNGYVYTRTVAPTVLVIDQQDLFDSFCLFGGPGGACNGLAVWSIHKDGECLNVGWEAECAPGPFSEVANCCFCGDSGACDGESLGECEEGVKWGTAGGTGTNSCQLDCNCSSPGCCVAASSWEFPASSFAGQHSQIIPRIVAAAVPCVCFDAEVLWTEVFTDTAGTRTRMRSYVAVWCQGTPQTPLQGPISIGTFAVGAAFNTQVSVIPGGWVMRTPASNTTENKQTLFTRVRSQFEDSFQPVTFYDFQFYTPPNHPLLYEVDQLSGTGTTTNTTPRLTGLGVHTEMGGTGGQLSDSNVRIVANAYQVSMYQFSTASGSAYSNAGHLDAGALRTVPLAGESPLNPDSWDFKRATWHVGGARSFSQRGLYQSNRLGGVSSYVLINDGTTNTLTSGNVNANGHFGVGGFHGVINNNRVPLLWKSGEASISEPWVSWNIWTTASPGPAFGQMWDVISPYETSGTTGPWHDENVPWFWDNEWWIHWQNQKTVDLGPMSNLAFRVGWFDAEGLIENGPTLGTLGLEWPSNSDPQDIFLYATIHNITDTMPWGQVTGMTLDTSTLAGGTETATLTVTCTQDTREDIDDHTKYVAIHSPRQFLSFTPPLLTIGSGTTTATTLVTALSPGIGGVDAPIRASSINTLQITITVED